jgi:hypothetical protein
LSLLPHSEDFPLLAFWHPATRKGRCIPRWLSIWDTIFQFFDHFKPSEGWPLPSIPLSTLLSLPLHKALTNIPANHWSYRHPSFLVSMFMVFDPIPQRLRLKVSGEYTRYPVLCNGLLQAILVERNIGLAQFVWPHITDPPVIPAPPILEHPFLDLVHNNWGWQGYHPRGFRAYQDRHYQSPFDFDFDRIKTIWSTMMYPQARTVWYRVLTGKIPHNTLLFSFGLIPSPLCSFCHQQADNIQCLPRLFECLYFFYKLIARSRNGISM